jgi:hypothetical protein
MAAGAEAASPPAQQLPQVHPTTRWEVFEKPTRKVEAGLSANLYLQGLPWMEAESSTNLCYQSPSQKEAELSTNLCYQSPS